MVLYAEQEYSHLWGYRLYTYQHHTIGREPRLPSRLATSHISTKRKLQVGWNARHAKVMFDNAERCVAHNKADVMGHVTKNKAMRCSQECSRCGSFVEAVAGARMAPASKIVEANDRAWRHPSVDCQDFRAKPYQES